MGQEGGGGVHLKAGAFGCRMKTATVAASIAVSRIATTKLIERTAFTCTGHVMLSLTDANISRKQVYFIRPHNHHTDSLNRMLKAVEK